MITVGAAGGLDATRFATAVRVALLFGCPLPGALIASVLGVSGTDSPSLPTV